ncbi:MAG TPA: 3-hydroxyacyl-CoA dehydrogenase NAD-binding domain-containing protein [Solirubrobacteraceae bacterium]|nr:3-hydroxyacyl-CoA dehydrogenase NAD-binding domain-containing protein [Solirubrobacteraceae bacterium]
MSTPSPAVAPPSIVGVCGAGTMGAGIAQLVCQSGATALLHDPDAAALARGQARIRAGLARSAERGRLTGEQAERAAARLRAVDGIDGLRDAELVIEAAPESLSLKAELFKRVAAVVGTECVLATNTSSLLVTELAAAVPVPERVVGMHYFNPPPVMRLLEVVAGMESSPRAVALARAAGEAQGKHVIEAADGIGFLVNRCNRPFGLEALRLLAERVATHEAIDRICRLEGGFRMGPFELMDLVGVDTGLDIARSFFEQSFGEPRWRPSPISVRMVAAGRHGRKAGRGFYEYRDGEGPHPHRPPDPDPPTATPPAPDAGPVVVAGEMMLALELAEAAADAGWEVLSPALALDGPSPFLILDLTGEDEPEAPLQGAPQAICCAAGSLAAQDPGGSAVGFHALPPFAGCRLVELTRGPDTSPAAVAAAERFFGSLGRHVEWVADAPGLVLGRIVCQVINEAAFALGEGVGSAADIDAGFVDGLNYPRGVLAWADGIGLDHVVSVLDALRLETGEERFRVAPELRRLTLSGRLGEATGEGFFRTMEDSG